MIFGKDIKIDSSGNIQVTASGEVILTDGIETGLQDIKIRLETPLGSLFYHNEFGSTLYSYLNIENTLTNRMLLCAEIKRRINLDPRVVFNSVNCSVQSWDENGVTLKTSFIFKDTKTVNNLILSIGSNTGIIIKNVNTG